MARILLHNSYLNQDSNLKKTSERIRFSKKFFVFFKLCGPGNTLIAEMSFWAVTDGNKKKLST